MNLIRAGISSLLLSTAAASAADRPARLINGDFDTVMRGQPAGWSITGAAPRDGYMLDVATGEHGRAARVSSTIAMDNARVNLVQEIDASPWRGKNIALSGRLRIDGSGSASLMIEVVRPEPNATGFRDRSADRDPPRGTWFDARKPGYIDDDALTIRIGARMTGRGTMMLDDVLIAEALLPDAPPSPAASAYLDNALGFIKEQHIRSKEMDWPALTARAHRQIAGAQEPRDTYWVIRAIIGTLGEHHSFISAEKPVSAKPAPAAGAAPPSKAPMPYTSLVDGRFGLVALPALNTFGPTGKEDGTRYTATARAGLHDLDSRKLCGWIVDLRDNGGGNMWPMLNGVSALLGPSPYGAFVTPAGEVSKWAMAPQGVIVAGTDGKDWPTYAPFRLRQGGLPLAVLVSDRTASSGEAVTLAFSGRAGARRFGEPTAGFTSGNSTHVMPDGAVLAVASVWERDRTGRDYRERVPPEEATTADAALAAALRWLKPQCRKTRE